jgi:hypothetical protein
MLCCKPRGKKAWDTKNLTIAQLSVAEKGKREKLLVCELSASEGKTTVVNLALVLVVFLAGNKPASQDSSL